jgi:hypothetical protein
VLQSGDDFPAHGLGGLSCHEALSIQPEMGVTEPMSESEPLPPQAQVSPPYGVLVPCPPQEFADFISRLLGKPQIAEGRFSGPFTVTLHDIENFYFLIQQRIKEQNIGQLVQFTAAVKFDDGTSVELQSLEYLRAYSEVKPVVSIGYH